MAYKINYGCSTCHYCYNECPVHAIGFVGSDYAIDPEKCIDCGKCAEVCPSGIISNPDKPVAVEKHDPIELNCDLVVLGGGGAGLVSAVKAAQLTGKKVIVLEKAKKCGGNTNLGHGFMMRYTKWHEKAGVEDTRAEFIEDLYNKTGGTLDYKLLHDATYALSDMFDWLCEFGGAEDYFALKSPDFLSHGPEGDKPAPGEGEEMKPAAPAGGIFGPPMVMIDFPHRAFENLKCSDHSMGPGWMGTYVVRKMLEEGAKLGVEVYTGTPAKKLIVDENGKFKGVIAEDAGGEVRVNADCCIIATGGFSKSPEKMKKIRPAYFEGYPVHSFTVASCTGDAMDMVEEIGGVLDLETVKIPMFGPTHHPFHYAVVRLVEQPQVMRIDSLGHRFMNESERHGMDQVSIMEDVAGKYGWAIMDANVRDICAEGLLASAHDEEVCRGYSTWREQLEEETTFDIAAQKADTLEELADLMKIDREVFLAEVAKYNEYCAKGEDAEFGKDARTLVPITTAPFYAVFLARFNEGSVGGIVNDSELRVVKAEGGTFDGLFIAGDSCRGLFRPSDANGKFGEMPWAMASGYLAGKYAAEYIG